MVQLIITAMGGWLGYFLGGCDGLLIALVLFVLALGFFIPVFVTYLGTGEVPNFPTLIVCGFAAIASLQSLFTGLLLHNIVQKNKQDFEFELIKTNRVFRELMGEKGQKKYK